MSVVLNLYRWGAVLLVVTGVFGERTEIAMRSGSVRASAQPARIGAKQRCQQAVKQKSRTGGKETETAKVEEEGGGVVIGKTP